MNEIFEKLSKFTGQKYLIIDDNTTDLDHQPAVIVGVGPEFEERLKGALESHFDNEVESITIDETQYGFEILVHLVEEDDEDGQRLALIQVGEF